MVSDGAPLSQKIARLYLVSDILHNSSVHVTNAWKYRSGFEVKLPEVFQHFNKIYRSIRARLKAEQVRVSISIALKRQLFNRRYSPFLCHLATNMWHIRCLEQLDCFSRTSDNRV